MSNQRRSEPIAPTSTGNQRASHNNQSSATSSSIVFKDAVFDGLISRPGRFNINQNKPSQVAVADGEGSSNVSNTNAMLVDGAANAMSPMVNSSSHPQPSQLQQPQQPRIISAFDMIYNPEITDRSKLHSSIDSVISLIFDFFFYAQVKQLKLNKPWLTREKTKRWKTSEQTDS